MIGEAEIDETALLRDCRMCITADQCSVILQRLHLPDDVVAALDAAVLAGTCFNCHGPDGRSAGAIPSLQGRSAAELRQRLHAFQRGQAPDATVMTRLMKGYDDAQIVEIVQHVALNTWTNYVNSVARTEIDFPVVQARTPA